MNEEQASHGMEPQRKPPYGFFLVLAAIVVVAIMYAVTIYAIGGGNRTPETVFGAMAASFTVIGTLVGTYFGIKAGLDGQDKVKETIDRATAGGEERPLSRPERNGERVARGRSNGAGEPRVLQRAEEEQGWEERGV